MQVGLRHFDSQTLDWLAGALRSGGLSRHALGRGQVRDWIRAEHHGVLGGIGFGSAAWRLAARDAWIGWSAGARAANIGRVICNHRFLLLGGVRVDGLASAVLHMAVARVADDWEARYLVRPVAADTHVGPEHNGYCYHRAGWSCAGRGSGRRSAAGTVRVLALEDGWRAVLRHVERRPVGALAGGAAPRGAAPGRRAGGRL